ncbi:MAG: hypothetical protein AAF460_01020 [Pseudomonadota bacterium]
MDALSAVRRHYAEGICVGLTHADRLADAFAVVDRAACLLPPPWSVIHYLPGRRSVIQRTSRVEDLYHDRLVQLDASRDINNGQPSLWAAAFDCVLNHNPSRVLHLGCGSGYYTALLASLLPEAELRFRDLHPRLQAHAESVFAANDRVTPDGEPTPVDAIVCSFGCSVLSEALLSRWQDGGVLLAPVTDRRGRGVFVEAVRHGALVEVRARFYCRFVLDAEHRSFPERVVWRDAVSAPLPERGPFDLGELFSTRPAS